MGEWAEPALPECGGRGSVYVAGVRDRRDQAPEAYVSALAGLNLISLLAAAFVIFAGVSR